MYISGLADVDFGPSIPLEVAGLLSHRNARSWSATSVSIVIPENALKSQNTTLELITQQ